MPAHHRGRTRRGGALTPGEHLRAELERLGLNQIAVSKATGVTRQTINNIVNGRQAISRAMAAKLGRLTGRNSDYWLRDAPAQHAPAPRASGILVDHQIAQAIKNGVIGVTGFDESCVRAASLELTLGAAAARGLRVAPGRSVRVVTRERIALPHDHLARVGAAPQLARLGAIASHALHVEPGFDGKLEVRIFNAGEHDIVLRAGDPLVSLEFVPLPPRPVRPARRRRPV
jgi:addiction module HigA family antidote